MRQLYEMHLTRSGKTYTSGTFISTYQNASGIGYRRIASMYPEVGNLGPHGELVSCRVEVLAVR